MKLDVRAVFATVALALAACSGSGLDSGAGGMGGEVGPPVNGQGQFGQGGMNGMGASPGAGGPTAGPNGIAELSNPGSTLAPNQAQYPVGDGPTGLKCPQVGGLNCTFSFNVPASPGPSPGASGAPTAKPVPTPTASSDTSDASSDDAAADGPSPTPSPPGTITLQVESMPGDAPAMTNPDMRSMRTAAVASIRLQSDTDFTLNGNAVAEFTVPPQQFANRTFVMQLFDETFRNKKRVDTYIGQYSKSIGQNNTLRYAFTVPKVTVRRGDIWMLVLYGETLPPGSTATPSPSPVPSGSAGPSSSPSAAPTPTAKST
jgi:hypothetical protein